MFFGITKNIINIRFGPKIPRLYFYIANKKDLQNDILNQYKFQVARQRDGMDKIDETRPSQITERQIT